MFFLDVSFLLCNLLYCSEGVMGEKRQQSSQVVCESKSTRKSAERSVLCDDDGRTKGKYQLASQKKCCKENGNKERRVRVK